MKSVYVPRTIEELWDIIADHPEAELYAGGTDLLCRMRKGLVTPSTLVCIERVPELRGVRNYTDRVFIGACSTHSALLASPLLQSHFPVLVKALRVLGSPHIRNMGTLGGNIVTASPAGDTLPPLYALNAELEIRRKGSSRQMPLQRFILGPGRVDLSAGEVLAGVWLRKSEAFSVNCYEKVGQRKALAIAVVSMASLVQLSETGLIRKARLAWGSMGPTVITSMEVESFLVGKPLDTSTLAEAGRIARQVFSPIDDVRASAFYRREVAGNLLLRLTTHLQRDPQKCGPATAPGTR